MSWTPPYVVKADGLAAGKGVTVAESREEAVAALRAALVERAFGDAGERVLVEEFLEGQEVSALALTDGDTVIPLAPAQDHKRVSDGDAGPNTGGMGAYSPVPFVDDADLARGSPTRSSSPRCAGSRDQGIRYRGVLYAGLMLTDDGPKVLEFNCRFGDPETQAILPRLDSDLAELLAATASGTLADVQGRVARRGLRHASCWPLAATRARIRPACRSKDSTPLRRIEGVTVFHAGTARRDGRVVTAGGRVLAVSALGKGLAEARDRAYEAASRISFEGMHHRTDIAKEAASGD